jgi:hypothetical protein
LFAAIRDRILAPGYAVERALSELVAAATARLEGRRADATDAMARAIVEARGEGVDHDLVVAIDDAGSRRRTNERGDDARADVAGGVGEQNAVILDARRHELRAGELVVELKSRPVLRRLFYALAAAPRGVPKTELAWAIWARPYAPGADDNALRSNVTHLRRLIEGARFGIDFDGSGYRLKSPEEFIYVRA